MRTSHIHSRGFSLVEILVAMVIALLGTIIIFQVFSASEGIKRTSTSGGDAHKAACSRYTIERHARQAGFGLNFPTVLGCNVAATTAHRAISPSPVRSASPTVPAIRPTRSPSSSATRTSCSGPG
jgi:type IV pilus assembly protein PilW